MGGASGTQWACGWKKAGVATGGRVRVGEECLGSEAAGEGVGGWDCGGAGTGLALGLGSEGCNSCAPDG